MKVTIRQKSGMNYLYADVSVSRIRVKATLGISVEKGEFKPKTQTVKGRADNATNILLYEMKTGIMELVRDLQKSGKLTASNLKHGIADLKEQLTAPDIEREKEEYLLPYVEAYIERSKATRKSGTIRQYKVSYGKLKSYERNHRIKLRFGDLGINFYNQFVKHCREDLGLSENSIGTHIKNIKSWMNAACIDGLHQNLSFQTKAFKRVSEKADTIYLNEDELKRTIMTVMPHDYLENVRDIFVLACYTGVRIQDYKKLDRFHLTPDGKMLKIRTEKTGVEVVIPLHPIAKRIMDKYNGKPRMISNQKFNKYIKKVCEISGIDEMVKLTRTIGGKKTSIIKPKYELVSSHCARRSFATNAYKARVPTLSIMAITGHKTESVFMKYIRVSAEEHAKMIGEHRFFRLAVA